MTEEGLRKLLERHGKEMTEDAEEAEGKSYSKKWAKEQGKKLVKYSPKSDYLRAIVKILTKKVPKSTIVYLKRRKKLKKKKKNL